MFLLVPAHPGFPGQIPQSRKTVVCCVCTNLFVKFFSHIMVNIIVITVDHLVCLQLSSIHQIMIAQLSDGMMHPVNKFLQADVDGSSVMILCFSRIAHYLY